MVELAVVTASSTSQWLGVFSVWPWAASTARPLLRPTRAEDRHQAGSQDPFSSWMEASVPLTSGLKVRVEPGAINVCAPASVVAKRSPRKKTRPRRTVSPAPRAVEKEEATRVVDRAG